MADSFELPENLPMDSGSVTAVPEVLQAPAQPVKLGFVLFQTLTHLCYYLTFYPITYLLLPAQVLGIDPLHKVTSLSVVITVGAFASLIGPPLAGALSDRTTSRLGRRRPWILGGALVAVAALLLLAHAPTILLVALSWGIAQAAGGAMLNALGAIIADRVPQRQRGTISALVFFFRALGNIVGAVLVASILTARGNNFALVYGALSVLLVLPIAILTLTYRESPLPSRATAPFHLRRFLANFWVNPRAYPDFAYAWLASFLLVLGESVGTGYFNYYLRDVIQYAKLFPGHAVEQGVATLSVISTACLILSALVSGPLSDRLQRRKAFMIGAGVLIALALLLLALVHSWPVAMLSSGLISLGFGAYLPVNVALVIQVLPRAQDRAKDLGLIGIAQTSPSLLAPTLGALAIGSFATSVVTGYTLLFVVAAVLAALGTMCVLPIKHVR
ncbi:MAG: MFS transporter [Ktedonobacteraceae bacterium]